MTAAHALKLQTTFVRILKAKFTNLTAEEASQLAGDLVLAVVAEDMRQSMREEPE